MATTTIAPPLAEAKIQEFATALRGDLIRPGDPSYDAARQVYNAMIDRRPALIARCVDVGRRHRRRQLRPRPRLAPRRPRRRPQRRRPRHLRRRPGHRPLADEGRPRRPGSPHRPRRRRLHLGRRRPRHPRLRPGDAQRHHLDHRRRRPHPRRRPRPPDAASAAWPSTTCSRPTWCWPTAGSSPPTNRSTPICSGRCAAAAATSASSPRSCSGCTRSTPSTPGRCSGRWSRAAEVLRWYRDFIPAAPDDLNGFFAFLIVPPAPPFPEHLHEQEDVRRRLVLHRPARPRPRRRSRRSAAVRGAGARLGRPAAPPGAAEHVRRALPAGRPVVLEGRLRQRAHRRGDRAPRRVRLAAPNLQLDDAPLPDRRGGRPRRPRTPPPGTTGRPSGAR